MTLKLKIKVLLEYRWIMKYFYCVSGVKDVIFKWYTSYIKLEKFMLRSTLP